MVRAARNDVTVHAALDRSIPLPSLASSVSSGSGGGAVALRERLMDEIDARTDVPGPPVISQSVRVNAAAWSGPMSVREQTNRG